MNIRFYRFMLAIARFLVAILYPIRVAGLENIPESGGAILCCNHISNRDPVLVACAVRRPVRFMAKAELFRIGWMTKFWKAVGAFPVKRGDSDMGALRTSLGVVNDGGVLGIFAQGHRDKSGELTMESGVALIALRTQAPVVPVFIAGSYRLFRRFHIIIGQPVDLSRYTGKYGSEQLKGAMVDIEGAVRALKPVEMSHGD